MGNKECVITSIQGHDNDDDVFDCIKIEFDALFK